MNNELTFAEQVAAVVRKIPYGMVTSYGLIALALGAPRSARLVGWSLNRESDVPLPAHRVVNKEGYLSGGHRFGHPDVMKALLLAEGVTFREEYVVDMEKHLWDPSLDLEVMAIFGSGERRFDPPPDFPLE